MTDNNQLLRPIWRKKFTNTWKLVLLLFLILVLMRCIGSLGPLESRMYIILSFIIMWFLPFIFFSKTGRRKMGLKKIEKPMWFLWSILLGVLSSLAIFLLGFLLFGHSDDNWFISILVQTGANQDIPGMSVFSLFLMFTIPSIVFSPIGEELFFRGMIQESVKEKKSKKKAIIINSLAFASIHLFHHGIVYNQNGLNFLVLPGILWFFLMIALSWIFTECRERSGSIIPSIISHSAFNLTMMITIFMFLR